MKFAAGSDRGLVRELNEDSYRIIDDSAQAFHIFIVADGMGGHNCGEIASRMAVEYIAGAFEQMRAALNSPEILVEELKGIVEGANKAIFEASVERPEAAGMGTTLTMAVFCEKTVAVAHVGDSRLYRIRKGEIRQLTEDHSYIGELIKNGSITREEAESHPGRHIITRAIGASPSLDVDISSFEYKKGDIFILCTDGLTNMISEAEMLGIASGNEPGAACAEFIGVANSRGGDDNITVIVIKCE